MLLQAFWLRDNNLDGYNTTLLETNNITVLSQKLKYKEKFDKEMKGKRPQYDMKNSKIYQTLKDANDLASEVLQSLKKRMNSILPVTNHIESVSYHGAYIYHAGEVQR